MVCKLKQPIALFLLFLGISCFQVQAQYSKLLDFTGVASGSEPKNDLYFDGTLLYGLSKKGGISNLGTIFKIKPDGTGFVKLLDFSGAANGQEPLGSLISDGTFLYGTTSFSGSNGGGTVFKIKPDGTGFATVYAFSNSLPNPISPKGSLIFDGTYLYGTTSFGGSASSLGTVYKVKPDGTGFTVLTNFSAVANGQMPAGALLFDGTNLYGMTERGGTNTFGVIFKILTDGSGFTKLLDFSGSSNGRQPIGSLISDGTFLYGATEFGGANGDGALFKIKPDGTGFQKFFDFNFGTVGSSPSGTLLSVGPFLYGMTFTGGATTKGNLFKINPDGTGFTPLLDFTGAANGSFTIDCSLIYSGGVLYGMTSAGGTSDLGTIFKYVTTPTITAFAPASGPVGTSVIINGFNFSTTPANNIVYFGAVKAVVTAATSTQLTVQVPIGATFEPITVTANDMTASSAKPFIVTFAGGGVINACSFAAPIGTGSTDQSNEVALGDLDGDGKADVAITDYNFDLIRIYRNISTAGTINASSFEAPVDFAMGGIDPLGISIADIDSDGKLDIIASSWGGSMISILRNTTTVGSLTTASFAARLDLATGAFPLNISCQDLDGDGKTDIAVGNAGGGSISIWQNIGNPGLITAGSFNPRLDVAGPSYGFTVADMDLDGKPDLIGGYNLGSAVGVSRNISSSGTLTTGSFAAPVNFTVGAWPENLVVGDLDADNRPDIVTSSWPSNTISIVKNTSTPGTIGAGSFATSVNIAGNGEPRGVTITDFDGDGLPDIGLSNQTSNVSIYKNANTPGSITTASFLPKVNFSPTGNARGVMSGDIDGDGRPDLVVATWGGSFVVLRNTMASTLGTPSPSTGFIGTTIIINGTNFSTTPANNVVKFNGTSAVIISSTVNTITVKVPVGATTGPVTVDVCGQAAAGAQNFTVTNFAPNPCQYVTLNGTTDYITIASNAALQPTSLTVEALVNFSSIPGFAVMISQAFGSANQSTHAIFYQAGSLRAGVNLGAAIGIAWTPTLGQWYHVALTYDNLTSKEILYLDGIAVASGTIGTPIYDAKSLYIGSFRNSGTADGFFNGKIDEVRLWKKVRTEAEIQATISSELIGNESELVAYYKLNEFTSGAGITTVNSATSTGPVLNGITVGSASTPSFLNLCKPTITSFSPASGPIGTTVTINGSGFDSTPANNTVFFGATRATVTAATTGQLTVTVPAGATYQPITVNVGGLIAYSAKSFTVTFPGGGTIDACSFAPKVDFTTGSSPVSVSIGDLDGDGKADLAVANFSSDNLSIFRNTSSGAGSISYAAKVDFITGSTPESVSIGDLDGDGKLDLAATNRISSTVSVFRNTSSGAGSISNAAKVDFNTTGTVPPSVSIGDLDGDGKADLVVANYGSSTISVFRNTSSVGSINYATKVDFTTGAAPQSVSIGDLDGDGKADVAVPNYNSNTVSVFLNTSIGAGSISYAAKVDFITGSNPEEVSIGDLDGDGKADLAVANYSSSTVSVFRNTSSGTGVISYAPKVDFTTGTDPQSVSIGDLDGDGKADLAVANETSASVSLFRNTSSIGIISYAPKVDFTTGTFPQSVSIGDLDGDGKADLAVANIGSATVSVFRNTIGSISPPTIASFSPGSGAIGTTVTITGTNFDPIPANNNVLFNGTAAVVSLSTASSITTVVPVGATTGTISIAVGCNTATSSGVFTVTTITITINTQPLDFIACVGQIATFTTAATGTTNITYQWQFSPDGIAPFVDINNGGGYSNATTSTLSVNTTGMFGLGRYRCRINGDLAAQVITFDEGLFINAVPPAPTTTNASSCIAASVTLTASGGINGQYRWYAVATGGTAIAGQVNSTYTTPVLSTPTNYFVSLKPGSCESPRSLVVADINVVPKPIVVTSNCTTTAATLSGPNGFANYAWSNGAVTQQINVTAAGSYTLIVTTAGGCNSPASDPTVFTSTFCNQSPVIAATSVKTVIEGSVSLPLSALLTDPDNNLDVSTLKVTQQPTSGAAASIGPNATLLLDYKGTSFAGTDKLTIEVCDFSGVCAQSVISIEVAGEIIVNTGISPNGDTKNDTWFIQYIDALPDTKDNKVSIFNRWGDAVFETSNYDNVNRVFIGLNKSGNELPTGTYFYKIEFASGRKTMTGYLSLKR